MNKLPLISCLAWSLVNHQLYITFFKQDCTSRFLKWIIIPPPTKMWRGYTGFTTAVCLSVCLWKSGFRTITPFPFDKQWWWCPWPEECKIQKNWCTVTMAPTIEHHGAHSRTPVNQSWDQVPGRSHLLILGSKGQGVQRSRSNSDFKLCTVSTKLLHYILTYNYDTSHMSRAWPKEDLYWFCGQ